MPRRLAYRTVAPGATLGAVRVSPWPRTPQALQETIRDPEDPIGQLVDAERARAERLLNYVRGVVLIALAVAALAYSTRIPPTLHRLNFGIIIPLAGWTLAQHWILGRSGRAYRWLAVVNPIVDITAVTALLVGYGAWGMPVLAVKTPIFLAYFIILAARPMTSSTRLTAFVSALATLEYAGVVALFVLDGRIQITGDPIGTVISANVSFLDQGARIFLLGIAGGITTYATAWHERLLRRALAAQVEQAAAERDMEGRLRDADKLAALGTLATSVAHEVSNPLASIAAIADMMQMQAADDEVRKDAETIAHEARRTDRVIRDLLMVARPRAAEMAEVSLHEMTERALGLLRIYLRDAGVAVETKFDPRAPTLRGDAGRLEQVVINLVINAVHALERASNGRAIRISTEAGRDALRYAVEDTGPGLSPEVIPRIFERFFTTKPVGKGTGLGLWIARQIVEEHGGTISAANASSGGARFEIRFPLPAGWG